MYRGRWHGIVVGVYWINRAILHYNGKGNKGRYPGYWVAPVLTEDGREIRQNYLKSFSGGWLRPSNKEFELPVRRRLALLDTQPFQEN